MPKESEMYRDKHEGMEEYKDEQKNTRDQKEISDILQSCPDLLLHEDEKSITFRGPYKRLVRIADQLGYIDESSTDHLEDGIEITVRANDRYYSPIIGSIIMRDEDESSTLNIDKTKLD